jgi:hypothetical protein
MRAARHGFDSTWYQIAGYFGPTICPYLCANLEINCIKTTRSRMPLPVPLASRVAVMAVVAVMSWDLIGAPEAIERCLKRIPTDRCIRFHCPPETSSIHAAHSQSTRLSFDQPTRARTRAISGETGAHHLQANSLQSKSIQPMLHSLFKRLAASIDKATAEGAHLVSRDIFLVSALALAKDSESLVPIPRPPSVNSSKLLFCWPHSVHLKDIAILQLPITNKHLGHSKPTSKLHPGHLQVWRRNHLHNTSEVVLMHFFSILSWLNARASLLSVGCLFRHPWRLPPSPIDRLRLRLDQMTIFRDAEHCPQDHATIET